MSIILKDSKGWIRMRNQFPFLRTELVLTQGVGQPEGGPASRVQFLTVHLVSAQPLLRLALLSTYNMMDPYHKCFLNIGSVNPSNSPLHLVLFLHHFCQ